MKALHLSPKPATEVLYPVGSVVVCHHCGKPLYRLQASIYVGEPLARSAWKYAPVSVADVVALMGRRDLEAGVVAALKSQGVEGWKLHCETIPVCRPGDFFDCSACGQSVPFIETRDGEDAAPSFGDRGYLIQLAIIPPVGQSRRVH